MKLSWETAELGSLVQRMYETLLAKRYQEVIFHDLAHRGLGADLIAICPFHPAATEPSLHIHGDSPTWRCFAGCGSGNWIRYLQKKEGLGFWAALDKLMLAAQLDLRHYPHYERWRRETEVAEAYEKVLDWTQSQLRDSTGKEVLSYLKARKLSEQHITAMELGALPDSKDLLAFLDGSGLDKELLFGNPREGRPGAFNEAGNLGTNRVIIPFRDEIGRIFTLFTRTTPATKPQTMEKYRPISTMTDERDVLFNLHAAGTTDAVLMVEGSFDASRASLANIPNVVATNGVCPRPIHLEILRRRGISKILLVPDTDKVGQERAVSTIDFLAQEGFSTNVVELPPEFKDVDSLLGDLGAVGVEIFRRAISAAKGGMEWRADKLAKSHAQDPSALSAAALDLAAKIARTEDVVQFLAAILAHDGTTIASLHAALEKLQSENLPKLLKAQYLAAAQQSILALGEGRSADFAAHFEECKTLRKKLS